jgi:Lon protease-like protein
VLLIRSGEEVGGPAEPFDVGTTALVARVQRLPDDRMNIIAVGERRFRVARLDADSELYLQGEVEYLESEGQATREARDLANRVAALFAEQERLTLAVTGQWAHQVELPSKADRLADFVVSRLDLPVRTKQELLETLPTAGRLRREAELLGERIRELNGRWEERRQEKFAGVALN